MSDEFQPSSTKGSSANLTDVSAFKRCLQAVVGIPTEAAINQFGAGLSPEQADYLRKMSDDDIERIRKTESSVFAALGESGDGCGVYN